jgi:hypothetical protein
MKKIVLVIVMMCYLAVTSGVVINFHYCMNRLASTELFKLKSERCGKCGMHADEANGCCHDELQVVKLDEDQKITHALHFDLPSIALSGQRPSAYLVAPFTSTPNERHFVNHSPPLLSSQDSYVQNSVFRI